MRSTLVRSVALAVIGTRLPVLLVGALAVTIVGTQPPPVAEALWRVSPNELVNMLARWDTAFYHSIATNGYHWNPAIFAHENVVFFPFYPLLMRGVGWLLGGSPLLAGLLVSLVAFAGAMALVYRLVVLEMGDDYAWRVVLLISTFPYALFFSAVYTESLFLFLSVGAFYAMRRGYLVRAAALGLAAGMTRPNGFWLALPLFLLTREIPDGAVRWSQPSTGSRRIGYLAACAPLAGVAVYSVYLHFRFHDALAWLHGQAAWGLPLLGRPSAPDPATLPNVPVIKPTEVITWIGNIGAFAVAASSIGPTTRRFGAAYGAWIAINIFPPVATHLFMSLGRFIAVLFPFFFWLALRIPRSRLVHTAAVFTACQLVLAAWFFLWRPVV
jgi:mannosyltransferase PIG-V